MKQLIRKAFNLLGYSLVKNIKPLTEGTSTVKVGNFELQLSNGNGLKECYWYSKEYGASLTRLTSVLNNHFLHLSAVDIGANQGDSVALIKTGADVPVISVEGDGMLAESYASNTAQFKNVQLIKTFLSDRNVEMDCTFTKVGHNLTIVPSKKSNSSTLTKFSSIDYLYQNKVLNDSCKLLKIDTEGFDLKIIRGGDKFIASVKPAILFEFNRENLEVVETDPFSIFPWLHNHNYNTILFYESDGRFMFSSTLSNQKFMKQMFDYVDGKNAKIYYMDIIAFHADDDKVADELIAVEEQHRLYAN
ncbi:FkbM family methyltransferase [Mucilaginibacter psychrotolerans]|uniref:FkbM family methyltransferase n=1 Tax=Mucilaginibacter psychrotolerans TaxID=1524096 RepID=A0A4Y8SP65_9SPHI|nr:FkbM family methyltransferase [Mucilaginibacter psychrotolerans]TFF40869.1 FkbM family methyltransferase [Mucilaginibacter psychrotolerans]